MLVKGYWLGDHRFHIVVSFHTHHYSEVGGIAHSYSIRQKNRDILEKYAKVHDTTINTQNMFSGRFFSYESTVVFYVYFNIPKRNQHFQPDLNSSDLFPEPKKSYREIFGKSVNKT
jgi:hypothetical protein